ncbi:MAG: hypothetical protein ACLPSH_07170 [Vulcanimicrobiaceae bacterium]
MKEETVYPTLRAEMTQTLFAFRQLLIGELSGYAALVASLFVVAGQNKHAYVFPALVTLHAAIGFLIVTTTSTGNSWLSHVFRQGAYILVAFEIPALVAQGNDSKGRGPLWIMANRSEALLHKGKAYQGLKYSPGTELGSFALRQAGLSILASAVMAAIVADNYQTYFASEPFPLSCALAFFALAALATPLYLLYREYVRSQVTLKEHTTNWLDYLKNRATHDDTLLKSYGIDLSDPAMLAIFGVKPASGQAAR